MPEYIFDQPVTRPYWFRVMIVLVCVAVIEFFGFLQPLKAMTEKVLQPLMNMSGEVVHILTLPYFVVVKNVQSYQRVQDLELRYAEAAAQLGELETLRAENQQLRQLLNDQTRPPTKHILASIIGYSHPFVSAGASQGIQQGDMVLVGNTFIGRIGELSDNQAEVVLVSNPNGVPILATTEHGATGVITGDGRRVILDQLSVDADVQTGERVTTVGQAGVAPGISLGRVMSVEKRNNSPIQKAIIDQVVSFYEAQVVEIQKE